MTVKVDKEVLAATVVALDDVAADVPDLFTRAAGLDAADELSGLRGADQWASDTSRDLQARIGVLEQMEQADPEFGGVSMTRAQALQIAGQSMTVEDALVTLRVNDTARNAWESTDPANLQEWFEQMQQEALRKLTGMGDETAEKLVNAYNDVQNLVTGGAGAVASMAQLIKVGGAALTSWLARKQIIEPVTLRVLARSPNAANWLAGALNVVDDLYLRGKIQFRYPGAFVPNLMQRALLTVAPRVEAFDAWVARMSTATKPYTVAGEVKPTLLARFLTSRPGQSATGWVSRILQTSSTGQLAERLARWGGNVFGRPWTNPVTGQVFIRGGGSLITMAQQSGLSSMVGHAGWLRVGGAGLSALATVDGAVGLWNNRKEHARLWEEGGLEGRAHVVGEYAETAFNASMTAALVAPNPVTLIAVGVTGTVWAGAEIVEHWDDITAAMDTAVDATVDWGKDRLDDIEGAAGAVKGWTGDRLEDLGSVVDSAKESKINPMNWF